MKDQPFLNVGDDEWTRVPNEVFDIIMAHITPAEFKVLMTVIRFTRGWQKDEDEITLDQIAQMTGVTKRGVINSISGLSEILTVSHSKGRHPNRYGLNKQWYIPEEWTNSELSSPTNSKLSSPLTVKSVHRSTVNSVHPPKKGSKERKEKSAPPGFEKFWEIYPRHVGKADAIKAWSKVPIFCHEAIFTALEQQIKQPQWTKDNGEFIPHPATWLNKRRWEDQVNLPGYQNGQPPLTVEQLRAKYKKEIIGDVT